MNVNLTTSSGTILTDIKLFHHTSLSGFIIAIDDRRYNFTMGEQIQAGWNWYGIGINYTTVFWSLCNQHQWGVTNSSAWNHGNSFSPNLTQMLGWYSAWD